jgi:hypothetical protein
LEIQPTPASLGMAAVQVINPERHITTRGDSVEQFNLVGRWKVSENREIHGRC